MDADSRQNPQAKIPDDSMVASNSGDSADMKRDLSVDSVHLFAFRQAFLRSSVLEQVSDLNQFGDIPTTLLDICLIFRYLIAMGLDEFDRQVYFHLN